MEKDDPSQTGLTLFHLLQNPASPTAWRAFVDRYGPKVHSWCRRWGLQHADADNVTQDVLVKLACKLDTYTCERGGFRAWLKKVAYRTWLDYLEGQPRGGLGSGDSTVLQRLHAVEARDDLALALEEEFDKELLREAMTRVRSRVAANTWEVFRSLALDGRSGAEVAGQLQMKVAAVFVARNRVQKMLREEVRRLEGEA